MVSETSTYLAVVNDPSLLLACFDDDGNTDDYYYDDSNNNRPCVLSYAYERSVLLDKSACQHVMFEAKPSRVKSSSNMAQRFTKYICTVALQEIMNYLTGRQLFSGHMVAAHFVSRTYTHEK